uniref:THAP-type domain-containing protein n=1 Tax=Leptobrachium leishanense TaxID=445787 RepID=A0A8C5PGC6_9ANUR
MCVHEGGGARGCCRRFTFSGFSFVFCRLFITESQLSETPCTSHGPSVLPTQHHRLTMTKCIVKGCPNTTGRSSGIKLYGFPCSLAAIRLWLQQIGNNIRDVDAFAQRIMDSRKRWIFRICSAHFSPQCFIWDGKKVVLRGDAVPTIFPESRAEEESTGQLPAKRTRQDPQLKPTTQAWGATSEGVENKAHMEHCHPAQVMKIADTLTRVRMVDASTSTDSHGNRADKGVQWPEFEFNFNGEPWKVQLDHFYPCSSPAPDKTSKIYKPPCHTSSPQLWRTPANNTTRFNSKSHQYGSMATCTNEPPEEEVSESELARERKFVVFESCLDNLLYKATCRHGDGCTARIRKLEKHVSGTFLSVTGLCMRGHRSHLWDSQPSMGGVAAGDLLAAAALLLSGSSFQNLQELSVLMGLQQISLATYQSYQKRYVFPAIAQHWQQERARLSDALRDTQVTLAADRQSGIPGYRSKYCLYTFLDVATSRILDFQIEQDSERVAPAAMEARAFKNCLGRMQGDFEIKAIVTDRRPGIGRIMARRYSHIRHEYDVWHYARRVERRLVKASKRRSCSELGQWVPAIARHLWWCASTSRGDKDMLRERWQSLLLHVTDKHEWHGASLYHACAHKPLTLEQRILRPWLRTGSQSYSVLKDIVLSRQVSGDLPHMSRFCHTGETELYHRFTWKYRGKRKCLRKDAMEARMMLAALAHNANIHNRYAWVRYAWKRGLGTWTTNEVIQKHRKHWQLQERTTSDLLLPMVVDVLKICSGCCSQGWQTRAAVTTGGLSAEPQPVTRWTRYHQAASTENKPPVTL